MKLRNIILCGGLILAAASGCARFESTSSNEEALQFIEAWLKKNHPGSQKIGNGVYVLEETPGDGTTYNGEKFIMIKYTISSMDGTISATNDEKLSQQLGTYDPSAYYGDRIWYTEGKSLQVGIEDMIKGMKIGGTRKALIPSWLMVNERMKNAQAYFENTENTGTTAIYQISINDFTDDILKWETGKIDDFNIKAFGEKLDTVSAGFYYKQIKAPTSDKAYENSDSYYINYTGRLLNGQVFDTTIRDTAKKYNIYNPSKDYAPVKIQLAEKPEDIKMTVNGSSGDVIQGFQKILKLLKPYERGVGIFVSNLGYGTQTQGNITPYSPLAFDVEITDKPE